MSRYPRPENAQYRREKAIEILSHVATGEKVRSAAKILFINPRTGEKYLDDLRKEMQAESVTHLVYIAVKQGIIN